MADIEKLAEWLCGYDAIVAMKATARPGCALSSRRKTERTSSHRRLRSDGITVSSSRSSVMGKCTVVIEATDTRMVDEAQKWVTIIAAVLGAVEGGPNLW